MVTETALAGGVNVAEAWFHWADAGICAISVCIVDPLESLKFADM